MAGKKGRPPVSTSFKPGNTAALGNDKTLRLADYLNKALDEPTTLKGYEEAMTKRHQLAKKLVDTALDSQDPMIALAYSKEIANRVDGMPKQSTELSGEVKIVTPIYGGLSLETSDEPLES